MILRFARRARTSSEPCPVCGRSDCDVMDTDRQCQSCGRLDGHVTVFKVGMRHICAACLNLAGSGERGEVEARP